MESPHFLLFYEKRPANCSFYNDWHIFGCFLALIKIVRFHLCRIVQWRFQQLLNTEQMRNRAHSPLIQTAELWLRGRDRDRVITRDNGKWRAHERSRERGMLWPGECPVSFLIPPPGSIPHPARMLLARILRRLHITYIQKWGTIDSPWLRIPWLF